MYAARKNYGLMKKYVFWGTREKIAPGFLGRPPALSRPAVAAKRTGGTAKIHGNSCTFFICMFNLFLSEFYNVFNLVPTPDHHRLVLNAKQTDARS